MGNVVGINVELPLAKLVSSCWQRSCAPRESFRSLQNDWNRLRSARNDVLTKIELQERNHMRRLEAVVDWLSQVEAVEIEFGKVKTDYSQQSGNKCFCGLCPRNFKTSYKFGKKLATVREDVVSLLERKPDEVAQKSLVTIIAERPVEPTVGMHLMLDEVWSYMEDEQVGIIGLYGMGGVGKTTLMKEVNNKLCDATQSFDVVFWIVISTNPSLSKVQNDIGRVLEFTSDEWKEKTQEDKAVDIYNVLKQKKYVFFLDDVWQRFDLLNLGVPLPDLSNKSKIVLTTRSKDVCGRMEAHKRIQVTCLNEDESWNLFRQKVGENTINAHPEILDLAKVVAKECDGLPLALIVIGRAMSCKTAPRAWNTAIDRLKKYTADFVGMGDQVLPLLKFSYDSISNSSMRSCFLYCSLYPEDYLIRKEDIIEKWICEGFLDNFVDLHEARNEGYEYIDTLVNASLLEECSSEAIKMHDIIREMAIWIGCECGARKNNFFVRAGVGLTETPDVTEFEGSERMSLMDNRLMKIDSKPDCPNLLTLFLNGTELTHIDNEFFQSMPNLRVLDLSNNANLKGLPEQVCELVSLQYLNFSHIYTRKLPATFNNLKNLKWLNMASSSYNNNISKGILASFTKLQVLILVDEDSPLNVCQGCLSQTLVEELESLKHLNDLSISVSDDTELDSYLSSRKLPSITSLLYLARVSSTSVDFLFDKQMTNLKRIVMTSCPQLELIMSYEINQRSKIINYDYIRNLRSVSIFFCSGLKNITVLTYAPNLERIEISICAGMKELFGPWKWEKYVDKEGRKPTPFAKLGYLNLSGLLELEDIYRMPLPFPRLKEMEIDNCPKLRKLPFNSSSCKSGSGISIRGQKKWWDKLEWEDEATRIAFSPTFSRR